MLALASVLTPVLEVAGIWLAVIGLVSAQFAAAALLRGELADEIARQAAVGAAIGFLYGFPVTVFAIVLISSNLQLR